MKVGIEYGRVTPNDILPTGRFFATLPKPNINRHYPRMADLRGEHASRWNGESDMNGEPLFIRVTHVRGDTNITLSTANRLESWDIQEKHCEGVTILLSHIKVASILNLRMITSIDSDREYQALLSFCTRQSALAHCNDNCQRFNPFAANYNEKKIKKPSELPVRRVSDINLERCRVSGFQNIQEVIDSLTMLREMVLRASTIPDNRGGILPISVALLDSFELLAII